ncbi:sec-independent translocase [Jatrophihabitans telluris]|uniref:Sec-independent translocase n=1 Tax=Jatrophihabitans telluris TaxID=2038343 RepID=A0ABY4QWY0_9ACTN|nr:sec-independent translocase [Jatrophihabitans telluris]UQX87682.1 sec-independent translocase [Jatrophihabitans telluris]
MFNIGPLEFVVLACVALLVFGPEKLPQLTKDAVRMLRTVRDMAQGARTQLTSELGPEFANFDLNSLNPKTAIRNAIMGDDDDLSSLNPSAMLQKALRGEDEDAASGHATAGTPVTYSTDAGEADTANEPMSLAQAQAQNGVAAGVVDLTKDPATNIPSEGGVGLASGPPEATPVAPSPYDDAT